MNYTVSDKFPEIYWRKGKSYYLDPIRKKLIYITPEETVRQRVIMYLIEDLHVPTEQIISEQHLAHYGIASKKRADIVIHATDEQENSVPLAVVECKAPNVYLDLKAKEQLFEYCDLTGADYAMLTNGIDQYCFKYDEVRKEYITLKDLPDYSSMLSDKYIEWESGELPSRIPFEHLEEFIRNDFAQMEPGEYGTDISKLTPLSLAVPVFNFWEGLLDTRIKMPVGKYQIFELIEDYGVRMLSYGNAGGGKFFGPYRSFLVRVNENIEFFSIGVTTYCKSSSPDKVKTCIAVAHDDEKEAHHALQLVVEDNLVAVGNKVSFYHHGKIAIGRQGSGKVDELRSFVEERYPQILCGNRFFLGSLQNDRLWTLNDPEVIRLIENMISYAMIRDEYRDYVKNCKKDKGVRK